MTFRAALGLMFLSAFAHAAEPIAIQIAAGRPVVENVFLNGAGPLTFLIDTGAETSHLAPEVAARAGLRPTYRVILETLAGESTAPACPDARIEIGGRNFDGVEFVISPLDSLRSAYSGVAGVLGQNVLSRFDYVIDMRRGRIDISPDPDAFVGTRVPLRRISNRPAIHTSEGELVLDSGATSIILYRRSVGSMLLLKTHAGTTTATSGTIDRLRIGDRVVRDLRAVFVAALDREERGLLPMNLFDSVLVCNSRGFVVLGPTSLYSRR